MIAATLIWGTAFSAQSAGMRFLDPLTFTALRSITAALALGAIVLISKLIPKTYSPNRNGEDGSNAGEKLLSGGFWCGAILAAASSFQQYGLKYTTAGKTGFLTALYIVIVPLLGIFFKRKTSRMLWLAVLLALAGSWLLCGGIADLGRGEIMVIACALIYSVHILVIDHYARRCDCVNLSCIQFIVSSALVTAASLIAGEQRIPGKIVEAMPCLLYCGIGSGALAFTLQMVAQKYLHPVVATLLMSLESVFALAGGWIFLHETLSVRELIGCGVMLFAVLLAQLPFPCKVKTL